MKVYKLYSDLRRYALFLAVHESDMQIAWRFNGSPVHKEWKPIDVRVATENIEGLTEIGDLTDLGTIPAFSARAVEHLSELLLKHGELLPLPTPVGPYYAYNVTTVIDALDVAHTKADWLAPDRILDVYAFSFHPEKLSDVAIFKIPQSPIAPVFVTSLFAEQVARAPLTGFALEEVWQD